MPSRFCSFLLAISVAGCTLTPSYQRPSIDIPNHWIGHITPAKTSGDNTAQGWNSFDNDELSQLVAQVLAGNNDLQAALQRIAQARAASRIAGADLWPAADLSGDTSRTHTDPGDGNKTTSNRYAATASVAYELDLWGRNRTAYASAKARAEATAFDHEALALVVISDTALAYAGILALDDRIQIADDNLKNAEEVLSIIQARFNEGSASTLELSQQKASLANARASIASLKQQQESLQHQLAVLAGKAPQGFSLQKQGLQSIHIPHIALVQPSELLQHRPDIESAEANLIAANIDIGTARAAFLPSLQLGLDTSVTANPATAPASLITSVASSLTAPLFHGGALRGELSRSKAKREELVATYRGTVLNALKEVEDALSSLSAAENRVNALKTSADESQTAYHIARERYMAGAIDFQTLLDTQGTLLQAEDSLAQAKLEHITAIIRLFKALGGWNPAEENKTNKV